MKFEIHHHHHDQHGLSEVMAALAKLRDLTIKQTETIIMAVRAEIQAVVDAINGLAAPLAALEAAASDEMKQIADLTAKVAAGSALSDDEKAALTGAVSSVNTAIAGVVAATPAATTAATGVQT